MASVRVRRVSPGQSPPVARFLARAGLLPQSVLAAYVAEGEEPLGTAILAHTRDAGATVLVLVPPHPLAAPVRRALAGDVLAHALALAGAPLSLRAGQKDPSLPWVDCWELSGFRSPSADPKAPAAAAFTARTPVGPISWNWREGAVTRLDLAEWPAALPAPPLVRDRVWEGYLGTGIPPALLPEGVGPFTARVLAALQEIPFGTTVTYGQLACRLGNPRAARAVGRALACNPIPLLVPCHRVVGAHGLGGYSGGQGTVTKRLLLAFEREHVARGQSPSRLWYTGC